MKQALNCLCLVPQDRHWPLVEYFRRRKPWRMAFVSSVLPVYRMLVFHSALPVKWQITPIALQKEPWRVGFHNPAPPFLTLSIRWIGSPSSEWEEEETHSPWGAETWGLCWYCKDFSSVSCVSGDIWNWQPVALWDFSMVAALILWDYCFLSGWVISVEFQLGLEYLSQSW